MHIKSKKQPGVLFKLDFEKAYDRVNWDFLVEVLRLKGFEAGYIHRIEQLVKGGQTAISINGEIGPYFRNRRGIRQGDPLSPLLFNLIGEAHSAILSRACVSGHIAGLVPELIPGGISHLQYADDTLIMIQNDEQQIANLNDSPIWAKILKAKYADADDLFQGTGQGGSPFWKALHKIKHLFKAGARHHVCDGKRTRFWLDWWHGEQPLKDRYPSLFAICDDPEILAAQVCLIDVINLRFRRALDQAGVISWLDLVQNLEDVTLGQIKDTVSWHLDPSGCYSVKSMYQFLSRGISVAHFKEIWKAKAPLKIRIFAWKLALDRLPTNNLLASRNGPSNELVTLKVCNVFMHGYDHHTDNLQKLLRLAPAMLPQKGFLFLQRPSPGHAPPTVLRPRRPFPQAVASFVLRSLLM
uniref:Uncharacterized protein n=1 Tax=Avena sativa TaxID=4498 RepID=A0ACD5TWE6_AVESA